jgi:hypothetical protein
MNKQLKFYKYELGKEHTKESLLLFEETKPNPNFWFQL